MKKYLTIDFGSTKLCYAIVSEELDVLKEGIAYTNTKDEAGILLPIKRLSDLYHEDIEGISITMPGVIDNKNGHAYSGGIYHWIHDYDMAGVIERMTGFKTAVCNDAKAAALAEIGYGSLKKVQNGALLMILNTGIGGAIKVNGKLLSGSHFAAGELSYMKGDYKDRDGQDDMFAWSCSLERLLQMVRDATGREKMNIIRVLAGVSEGNEEITDAFRSYASRLAVYIYNIQCVIDAERIVLGGTITDEPIVLDIIREEVKKIFDKAPYHNIFVPEITDMVFHSNSRHYGAVYHYRELFEQENLCQKH